MSLSPCDKTVGVPFSAITSSTNTRKSSKRTRRNLASPSPTIDTLLDAICARAEEWQLAPGWVPILADPDDEPLVQLAYDSAARRIVTHNIRHLKPARALGIEVLPPREFATRITTP